MAQELLLLEDVEGVGRKGDVVTTVRPGYFRNYLLPQKKALIAGKHTLRMRQRLQEDRLKQASKDKKDAELLAAKLSEVSLATEVKVDVEGRLYGSVTVLDVVRILVEAGYAVNKKSVLLSHPIKKIGVFAIDLKLNEEVPASFKLEVKPEGGELPKAQAEEEKQEEAEQVEEKKERDDSEETKNAPKDQQTSDDTENTE